MKVIPASIIMFAVMLFSNHTIAGVFKCSDEKGKTSYQSSPCTNGNNVIEIDIKSGNKTDLTIEENETKEKEAEAEALVKQEEAEKQKIIDLEKKRRNEAETQSALNQQLIKNNPIQFSAFAIPPYEIGKLPELVEKFKNRLAEIEKFRRVAALKALKTGECRRVEEDDLSDQSKPGSLVFTVACSSSITFSYNETELSE